MKHNRTVDRAVCMLDILAKHPYGLSLNEIVELMAIPKSSCFDILHTLVDTNMAESIGRDGKFYRIGDRTFNFGNQYIENKQILELAKNRIEIISNKYAKPVILSKDNDENVICVYKYQPKVSNIVANCTVGLITEYYNSIVGKCMLAFREDCFDLIDKYEIDGKIINKTVFIDEILQIRREKYVNGNNLSNNFYCSAVPIFDRKEIAIASLCLLGDSENSDILSQEIAELKQIASEISLEIGYAGEY